MDCGIYFATCQVYVRYLDVRVLFSAFMCSIFVIFRKGYVLASIIFGVVYRYTCSILVSVLDILNTVLTIYITEFALHH